MCVSAAQPLILLPSCADKMTPADCILKLGREIDNSLTRDAQLMIVLIIAKGQINLTRAT